MNTLFAKSFQEEPRRSCNLTWSTFAASEVPRGELPRETFVSRALEIARNHVAHQLVPLQHLEGSPVGLSKDSVTTLDVVELARRSTKGVVHLPSTLLHACCRGLKQPGATSRESSCRSSCV